MGATLDICGSVDGTAGRDAGVSPDVMLVDGPPLLDFSSMFRLASLPLSDGGAPSVGGASRARAV